MLRILGLGSKSILEEDLENIPGNCQVGVSTPDGTAFKPHFLCFCALSPPSVDWMVLVQRR